MNVRIPSLFAAALLMGFPAAAGEATSLDTPSGRYVEARTASVFAGACHYNGEFTTAGRGALLGWQFTGGSLAGIDAAAAVVADRNLDQVGAKKRSVVYLDPELSDAAARRVLEYLERECTGALGRILEVRRTRVDVKCGEETFAVLIGEQIELRGNALPDRACCKMPLNVWYDPFVPVTKRLVGRSDVFRLREARLEREWTRRGENDVFFGTLGAVRVARL